MSRRHPLLLPCSKINMYYSTATSCLKGIKAQYGWDAKNSDIIGSSDASYKTMETDIKLAANEYINSVSVAGGLRAAAGQQQAASSLASCLHSERGAAPPR